MLHHVVWWICTDDQRNILPPSSGFCSALKMEMVKFLQNTGRDPPDHMAQHSKRQQSSVTNVTTTNLTMSRHLSTWQANVPHHLEEILLMSTESETIFQTLKRSINIYIEYRTPCTFTVGDHHLEWRTRFHLAGKCPSTSRCNNSENRTEFSLHWKPKMSYTSNLITYSKS